MLILRNWDEMNFVPNVKSTLVMYAELQKLDYSVVNQILISLVGFLAALNFVTRVRVTSSLERQPTIPVRLCYSS